MMKKLISNWEEQSRYHFDEELSKEKPGEFCIVYKNTFSKESFISYGDSFVDCLNLFKQWLEI